MSGIIGIYNLNNEPISSELLKKMTDIIRHRGPDDEGCYINGNIGLGHRRLSVIDLSPAGHQPMCNEDGTIWITYNGEVYNYIELIPDLISKGHIFKSKTDTEVIIHSYEEYGEECLHNFNGMFAFAIFDSKNKKLFCARDRFGIKPFYYYVIDKKFLFASEIKALIEDDTIEKKPNNRVIYDYLAYRYLDHTEDTFFDGIKQLPPAHYLTIQNDNVEIRKYWDLKPHLTKISNDQQYAKKFYDIFKDSVRLRLRSDVPIGTCLSGGLDSSSIACVANKLLFNNDSRGMRSKQSQLKTFSSCFEDRACDEREYIQHVIDKTGIDASYVFPEGEELCDVIPEIIWHQEVPFAGPSLFAQWNVMKLASEREVSVLLYGVGAEEILAGSDTYFGSYFADLLRNFQIKKLIREMRYYTCYHSHTSLFAIRMAIKYLLPRLKFLSDFFRLAKWLKLDFVLYNQKRKLKLSSKKYKSFLDEHFYQMLTSKAIPKLLHYEERSSMAFSIETRNPFLDYRLVEFMFSLPVSQKIQKGVTKVALRNAMKGVIPDEVRTRMDKMGFPAPDEIWLRTVAKAKISEIINSESFKKRGYFKVNKIKKMFEEHCNGEKDFSSILWRCVGLELWFREFIDHLYKEV